MPDAVPAWLGKALPNAGAGHGALLVARLGSEEMLGRGGMVLRSAAFGDGDALDPCFTAAEEDAVAPPMEWTAPPSGTHEMVLVVEDPDSSSEEPYCHWLVWGIAPQQGQLLEGEVPPRVGKNALGNSDWLLPDPPMGGEPHNYVFQLFALDQPLTLMPGATRKKLVAAMDGHVVGVALLTGTFARSEDEIEDWDEDEEG